MASTNQSPPAVEEGDGVVFDDGISRTRADVTKVYDDGSFMCEWEGDRGHRGQIFRPKVFERSAFVTHEPASQGARP